MVYKYTEAEDKSMRLGFLLIAAGLLSLLGLGCCWLRPALQERGGSGSANCTVLAVRQLGERFACTFSCGAACRGTARYPCLQVLVRTSRSPAPALLHEDERQLRTNPKVRPALPKCGLRGVIGTRPEGKILHPFPFTAPSLPLVLDLLQRGPSNNSPLGCGFFSDGRIDEVTGHSPVNVPVLLLNKKYIYLYMKTYYTWYACTYMWCCVYIYRVHMYALSIQYSITLYSVCLYLYLYNYTYIFLYMHIFI